MNVFVLGPGRCGTTTFIRACQHISNYTAGHETKAGSLARERFPYPEHHIEADNRLTWLLGYLEKHYGDEAFYVYMTRQQDDLIESFVKRFDFEIGIMKAYARGILMNGGHQIKVHDFVTDYLFTVDENITAFLNNKNKKMHFHLENYDDYFREFWNNIGAEGDLDHAIAEWSVAHNASNHLSFTKKSLPRRLVTRTKRALTNQFLRST